MCECLNQEHLKLGSRKYEIMRKFRIYDAELALCNWVQDSEGVFEAGQPWRIRDGGN